MATTPAPATGIRAQTRAPVRFCLVRPPTLTSVGAVGQDAVPPIGPAYVTAAAAAAGHEVSAVDAVGDALDQYTLLDGHENILIHGLTDEELVAKIPPGTSVIGVSSMFSVEWPITQRVISSIRAAFPDAMIALGGEHATAAPDYSLDSCPAVDVVVLGEGEETIVDLLDAVGTGRDLSTVAGIVYRGPDGYVNNGPRKRIREIDDIPAPNWEMWPVESYMERELTHGVNLGRCMPLLASRGCPYQCTFCSSPQMWTTLWKARDPRDVLAEMKSYMERYGATNFDFYDLTAIVKKSWIVEFCTLLAEEKLDITWQLPSGTRSEAIDDEVAQLLYRSGCRSMNYAPETGSAEELKRIKKRCDLDRMLESVKGAHKAGIAVKVNFIFGLPGETWKDVRATFRFFAKLAWIGVEDVACFPYSPYPGSELFDELVEKGKLKVDEEYFISLMGYTDIPNSVSYSDYIGSRQLAFLNMSGMAFFYGLSMLFRPWRFFALAWGILAKRNSSKLTMALSNTRRKRRAKALFEKSGQQTVIITPN